MSCPRRYRDRPCDRARRATHDPRSAVITGKSRLRSPVATGPVTHCRPREGRLRRPGGRCPIGNGQHRHAALAGRRLPRGRSPIMKLDYVPLLRVQRELHDIPRGTGSVPGVPPDDLEPGRRGRRADPAAAHEPDGQGPRGGPARCPAGPGRRRDRGARRRGRRGPARGRAGRVQGRPGRRRRPDGRRHQPLRLRVHPPVRARRPPAPDRPALAGRARPAEVVEALLALLRPLEQRGPLRTGRSGRPS